MPPDARPGFLALPRALFASPAWKEKREFSTFEASVDLAGLASFSARDYDYKGTVIPLAARETPPLSVRFLLQRWGWKSTSTVSRYVASLVESGDLVQNTKRNTESNGIPNTYFVGGRMLAFFTETPNETSIRTPFGTKEKKEREEGSQNKPPPTEGSPEGGGEEKVRPKARPRKSPTLMVRTWQPNEGNAARAVEWRLNLPLLLDDFRDYWIRKEVRRSDWDGTFRNRLIACVNEGHFLIGGSNGNGRNGAGRSGRDDWRYKRAGESARDDPIFADSDDDGGGP